MPDIADLADIQIEQSLEQALRRRAPVLQSTGRCYNCEAPLPAGTFCDPDCREDWEKREKRRA